MVHSFYLRLFFLSLPGMYLALWLSRFSLSMVNAMPYYYGMIMTAVSFFSGMLISFMLYPHFRQKFNRNLLPIMLGSMIFILAGHLFNIMDAGINAHYEIFYYFAGLSLLGFLCCLCMQLKIKKEKNAVLGGFITGSIISYFIGIKYFEQSHLDIYLGIPVFAITFLNFILYSKYRSWQRIGTAFLLTAVNIILCIRIHIFTSQNFNSLTNLGYCELKIHDKTVDVIDHKKRIFKDVVTFSTANVTDLPIYQLQTNRSNIKALFVGYPGSLTPLYLYRSPFIEKIDMYFWDLPTPKGFVKATVAPYNFYISEWNFLKNFKQKKYDLIVIENMPEESESARRIFIHYARKMLNQPHGVIAFPEVLARKYDGQYLKADNASTLVMLMGGESTEKVSELEKRCEKFLSEKLPANHPHNHSLPSKLILNFDSSNSSAAFENTRFSALLTPAIWHFLIWASLGVYLIWRLVKCRYKNNQNGFFAFETGFTFSVLIFCSLMLLSELRLVYPYFTPALFGISVMVMLPWNNKKAAFIMQACLAGLLVYFTSINFVRALPPIYLIPLLMPFSFIAIANTLNNCKMQSKSSSADKRYIFFSLGVLLTLILLICAKNNNLYPQLVYIALITRFFYYLKI